MMKDKIQAFLRAIILVPVFVVITTLWVPFMLLKDIWLKSAKEVNSLFDSKQGDVIHFRK